MLRPARVRDHHVGVRDEAADHRGALVRVGVDGDTALVAVHAEERRAARAALLRAPPAGSVAGEALALDHIGAAVTEFHRGVRARDALGEFDDLVSVQWPHDYAPPAAVL